MPETGLAFEDFEVGRTFAAGSRCVSEDDVVAFAGLSGDRNPLHLDEAYARGSVFGRRIAQGALGIAVVTGLLNQRGLMRGTLVAFTGLDWSFRRPLFPDTTVSLRLRVQSKRDARHPQRGEVVFDAELLDQAGAVLQAGVLRFLVERRKRAGVRETGGQQ